MNYIITSGKITMRKNGKLILHAEVEPVKPMPRSIPAKPLSELWLPDAPFSFQRCRDELERYGKSKGNVLNLNSDEVAGLCEALMQLQCLPSISWRRLFASLSITFELPFNNCRSLQGLKKTTNHKKYFVGLLSHLISNAEMRNE